MKKKIKDLLVVSDLDGTLITTGGALTGCSGDVIRLYNMLGGCFTIATGRNVESTRRFVDELGLNYPVIVYNGAAIYDYQKNCSIYDRFLPKAEVIRILGDLKKVFPSIGSLIMSENHRPYVTNATNALYTHFENEGYGFVLADENTINLRWYKVLLVCPDKDISDSVAEYINGRGYLGVDVVQSSLVNVEIVPEGITKGTALVELTKILNKDIENTVMIGDYYNDIPAFLSAGYTVVPSDAPEDIRSYADRIVMSSLEGGVAEYLYDVIRDYT